MPRINNRSPKKKTIHLACEGGAGGTEGRYIQDLCNKYNCLLLPNTIYKGSADPLTLAESAISFSERTKVAPSEKIEIWVVFDNDEPQKVKQAFHKINEYNSHLPARRIGINIALNLPVTETWGLLCCGAKKIPGIKSEIYSELKKHMKKYDHSRNPFFDFEKMELGYNDALILAEAWQRSLSDSGTPEYEASSFAGIYKIVKSIKE